jgi:hypothetical protein
MRKPIQIDLTSEQVEVPSGRMVNTRQILGLHGATRSRIYPDRGDAAKSFVSYCLWQETEYERVRAECSDFVTKHTRFPTRAFGGEYRSGTKK